MENNNTCEKMEDYEKELMLGLEAIRICEEILKYIGEKDIMKKDKAKAYCEFFLCYKMDGLDTKELKLRCKKYLKDYANFNRYYKLAFNDYLNEERFLELKRGNI